jgi:hypothetical protein
VHINGHVNSAVELAVHVCGGSVSWTSKRQAPARDVVALAGGVVSWIVQWSESKSCFDCEDASSEALEGGFDLERYVHDCVEFLSSSLLLDWDDSDGYGSEKVRRLPPKRIMLL